MRLLHYRLKHGESHHPAFFRIKSQPTELAMVAARAAAAAVTAAVIRAAAIARAAAAARAAVTAALTAGSAV